MHDIGKLWTKFNDYIRGRNNIRRGELDHSYQGAKYIMSLACDSNKDVASLIARVIISHHGIHDWLDSDCKDYFSKRLSNEDGYESAEQNIHLVAEQSELLDLLRKADAEYKAICARLETLTNDKTTLAFYFGMLERVLQSALMDADRTDTAIFMNKEPKDKTDTSQLWEDMQVRMNEKLDSFSDKTDAISLQRRSISDRCAEFAKNDVGICRMIVPTGGGKTLSSMRFAIEYCLGHDEMRRIVYTAPFMSILEQNSDEIRGLAGEDAFTEHHSNALAEFDDEQSNEYKEYELHTERWDSPVLATTMVQFLNSLFSGRSSCIRRMNRLCHSVIIIDEIQSLPLKCVNMFNLAMNFLSKICGAVVVLCSATQPVNEDTKYSLLIDENESMSGDYSKDFEVFKRTDIISAIEPYGFDFEKSAEFCHEKFSENGNLLVIVNTKRSALNLYKQLAELCGDSVKVIHLSTNMCPAHRENRINEIKFLLREDKPVICVTTQLIEAGVDISFKCVVRSRAGLDSVAQAAGRCNRHGEMGKICPVYIIKINEENIKNLPEISEAQTVAGSIISKEEFDDYQAVGTISQYFKLLYRGAKDKLSYKVKDGNMSTSLIELLSLNKGRRDASKKTTGKNCSQAFATAGKLFSVIDNNAVDVIVSYNENAEELITELEQGGNCRPLLRKAQRYTVSVYSNVIRKLDEHHALRTLECGAVVLDKEFYKEETGVTIEDVIPEDPVL